MPVQFPEHGEGMDLRLLFPDGDLRPGTPRIRLQRQGKLFRGCLS
jgi:hypothetical protein